LTQSRSISKSKIIGHSSRSHEVKVSKVVGATSSDSFLVFSERELTFTFAISSPDEFLLYLRLPTVLSKALAVRPSVRSSVRPDDIS